MHHAWRLKAATTRRTISDLVANAAPSPPSPRAKEPTLSHEALLKKLKADGAF